ncbi:ATP-binding protein [Nonomuraea sp. NPDC050536]|uniref:ATP-binding protein n=1 Tax=Nonomuraea sp. NPDC050536 TaxID=3364366 RepID=UPI0037CB4F6A
MKCTAAAPSGSIERPFAGLPTMMGEVRAWVLGLLPQDYPRRLDVALVATELATNTLIHSRSGRPDGEFTVRLVLTSTTVELAVVDQGPLTVPAPRAADESGRGLRIVRELADDVRWEITAEGRTTWARFVVASGGAS